jgi:hypothetical protein
MLTAVLPVPEAIVALTTATAPAAISDAFIPERTHVVWPDDLLQLRSLPTPVAAGPALRVTALTWFGSCATVHWRLAGLGPEVAERLRFRETVPLAEAVPEDRDSIWVCANDDRDATRNRESWSV